MRASQRAALSLLITVLLFAAFSAIAFAGLFDLIEARFYNPTITASISREITGNTTAIDHFFADMKARFSQTLAEPAVMRSFLINQSAEDIFERSRIFGLLHESIAGLQWVRIIDYGGVRIHFSTYAPDILTQEALFLTYRNFNEPNFPYEAIAVMDGGEPKFTLDGEGDRILFSLPVYDHFEIYRGTALFSLSVRALSDMLVREGRLHTGHDIFVTSNPPGFLFGAPAAFVEEALVAQAASIWGYGILNAARLYSQETGFSLTLLSARSPLGFFAGRLVDDELFLVPQIMQIILLLSFFLTMYLTIFLLFNLKQDPVTIIQSRMKKLQLSLIEQHYEHKSDVDWSRWNRELEQRRGEINAQLKRGIRITSKKAKDIDTIIDKSWGELISAIRGLKEPAIDEAKLQLILNRFLAAIPASAGAASSAGAAASAGANGIAASPQVSAQASDVPATDTSTAAATFYEVRDMEDGEEIEALEELEEVELAEEVEELEEVELVEEVEELEEVELVEEVEELEEIESAEEVEELEEIESAEEVEELEEIESAEELEDDELIEVGAVLKEIEAAEAVEEAETAEEVGELEEVETAEVVEELEEVESAEAVEELEELADEDAADNTPNMQGIDVSQVASEIEFGDATDPENTEDKEYIWDDFEVVSPFSNTLSNFSDSGDNDDSKENTEDKI